MTATPVRADAHFLLFYDYAPDYLARRGEFRDAHLRLAWAAEARGELVLAGAYADPADGAAFVFRVASVQTVEAFALEDPYIRNGLVTRWQVRRWTTVVGALALSPVRPSG